MFEIIRVLIIIPQEISLLYHLGNEIFLWCQRVVLRPHNLYILKASCRGLLLPCYETQGREPMLLPSCTQLGSTPQIVAM